MNFNDLSPKEVESLRLDFMIDHCLDELQDSYSELSIDSKAELLFKLSHMVIEFSTRFYGV